MCPLIAVNDIDQSRHFYEGLLGQKVKFDFGPDVAFEGFSIHLASHFQGLLGAPKERPITTRAHNCELYFETEELEQYSSRLTAAGVEFIHGLQVQPWGQYVMRFYDPDGHIVEIGETMESMVRRLHAAGMSVPGISEKTKLPEEFVAVAIGAPKSVATE